MKSRNKKIRRFALKRRGYDVEAVEAFINAEQARADEVQMSQRERISSLSAECKALSEELAVLKGREEQIKCAFITATQNADKMTADVKARYSAELERLRLFRAKWTGAYEQLKDRYHFDKDALNMESVAVSIELELQKFLTQDFSLNKGGGSDEMEDYFRSEVERLTTQQLDAQGKSDTGAQKDDSLSSAVGELKEKLKEAERKKAQGSVAFSLEDALNPTESLADICKSLGLNSL